MPTDALRHVLGDPSAIARVATTFESIAAEVDATSAKLRSLAADGGSWSGAAASRAQARTITLPPKLDKVRASHSTAGRALRGYAEVLASAQQRSAAAIRAASIAKAELRTARSAHDAAVRHDAETARAALAAGAAPPSATAPRFEREIADAERELRRAAAANAEAHDDQERAARIAAASLRQASREGIQNKPWWRHALGTAAHWAQAAWVHTLRFVSKVAVTVSALAGLAALALAVAGIVFPPLLAAAGVLETISFASAAVALASDAGLAMTGHESWVGVGIDALALVPAFGSAGVRRFAPVLRKTKLVRAFADRGMKVRTTEATLGEATASARDLSASDSWADPSTLARHFKSHGPDFGATSETEYAHMASRFLQRSQELRLPTKIARNGTIRVFDPSSNTFGAYEAAGRTRTFFKPSSPTYWDRQVGKLVKDLMER